MSNESTRCPGCGYYNDTANHEYGCWLLHNITDFHCVIRPPRSDYWASSRCYVCRPLTQKDWDRL